MDLLQLGQRSRKTGLLPRGNLSKDKYDMEDIDEFFEDEGNSSVNTGELRISNLDKKKDRSDEKNLGDISIPAGLEDDTIRPTLLLKDKDNTSNFARKIDFDNTVAQSLDKCRVGIGLDVDNKNHSSLASPLLTSKLRIKQHGNRTNDPENDNNNVYEDEIYSDDDIDMSLSPVVHSPIKLRDDTISAESQNTLKEPLQNSDINMNVHVEDKSLLVQSSNLRTTSKPINSLFRKPDTSIDIDDSYIDNFQESITPPLVNEGPKKKTDYPKKITKSSLPSLPPEGLRRSKRTRIAPLAFWRNERIIYTRTMENVRNRECTLINDIKKIPLQEIKGVVRMPHLEGKKGSKSNRRQKSRNVTFKTKQSPQFKLHQGLADSKRSEWTKKKTLALRVFEGENNNRIVRTVAWAPLEGSHRDLVDTELEKFEVVTLFSHDLDLIAGGIIELPTGGCKNQRNSLDSMYTFHVINGDIEVKLNEDLFEVVAGCSFQIPCSNNFAFKNLATDVSRLFFVQNKKIPTNSEDEW